MSKKVSAPAVEERRPGVRVPVDLKASCGMARKSARFEAHLVDLSSSGLRLRSAQRFPIGTSLDIEFALNDPARGSPVIMLVQARVVRFVLDEGPVFEFAVRLADNQEVAASLRTAVLNVQLSKSSSVRRPPEQLP